MSRDGIILLAKQSGITSFSSLWQIKNALGTKKIGHTGTLDTFAEGLLVSLSGRLTRLAPYITDCDKEYEALIVFGKETDTLDPDGQIVRETGLPLYRDLAAVLPRFLGGIMQVPPAYSALHVDGQRASDLVRKGTAVELPPRPVTIHSIDILAVSTADSTVPVSPGTELTGSGGISPDTPVSALAVRIGCSKGTYIRSLARDIADCAGSCAHLGALRRTRIGPFLLADAAGVDLLEPFASRKPAKYGKGEKPPQALPEEIRASVMDFDPAMARIVGFPPVFLEAARMEDFCNGKNPSADWFSAEPAGMPFSLASGKYPVGRTSVFAGDRFFGAVSWIRGRPSYEFVTGRDA